MPNLVEFMEDAYDQYTRLLQSVPDPDAFEADLGQIEGCLRRYDPRLDPDTTDGCGPVRGPGLLPFAHATALMIQVHQLQAFFEIDDQARPYIMRVVRLGWTLSVFDPGGP